MISERDGRTSEFTLTAVAVIARMVAWTRPLGAVPPGLST
jgi:hypothetical protein